VLASDGFHTGIATSDPFTVTNQPPRPQINRPLDNRRYAAGDPVVLSGSAMDAEDGNLNGDALQWRLDGAAVGTGEELTLTDVAPGSYPLQLRATDSAAQTRTAAGTLEVAPLGIPELAAEPVLDGLCSDEPWAEASTVQLPPYDDGYRATVQIGHSASHLWLCFTGLAGGSPTPIPSVGARIDVDGSGDAFAQDDDFSFFINETGMVATHSGTGSGAFNGDGPGTLAARLFSSGAVWSAELRIDAATVGGWHHSIGIAFSHEDVLTADSDYLWPSTAVSNRPETWATAALGSLPQIESIDPPTGTAGSTGLQLTVSGTGFVDGATVRVDGATVPTTWLDDTTVRGSLPTSNLETAGSREITVINPGLEATPSNAAVLTVANLKPQVTQLLPPSATAGSAALTVVVKGSSFVPGATVYWNSDPRPTTYVDGHPPWLEATVYAGDLIGAQSAAVSVANPEPVYGHSNVAVFEVEPSLTLLDGADVLVCEPAGTAPIEVTLRNRQAVDVSCDLTTVDGTATAGPDYRSLNETLVIPAGSLSASTTVEVFDDTLAEGYETFTVHIDNVINATVLDPDIRVTIADQDADGGIPGDASGNCRIDALDLGLIVAAIDDRSFHPPGNADCSGTGQPEDARDLICVLHLIY
jgi:hypothetical protein